MTAVGVAFARREIVARNVDFFAADECVQLIVEQFDVEGFECFEIVFAVLVAHGQFAVDVVIVERDAFGREPDDLELNRESFEERRFARRRGTGDADDFDALWRVDDHIGELADAFFVKPFADADDAGDFAADAEIVESADAREPDAIEPGVVLFGEDARVEIAFLGFFDVGRIEVEEHFVAIGGDAEVVEDASRGDERDDFDSLEFAA